MLFYYVVPGGSSFIIVIAELSHAFIIDAKFNFKSLEVIIFYSCVQKVCMHNH